MTSKAEIVASQNLRALLAALPAGAPIEESAHFLDFQSALEFFLPAELRWRHEAFDAFRFAIARKVAPNEAEFVGLALLISDQAWTPIHLWLRLSADADEIAALDCRVGEPGDGSAGLVRIPYASTRMSKILWQLPQRIGSIQWMYRAARMEPMQTKPVFELDGSTFNTLEQFAQVFSQVALVNWTWNGNLDAFNDILRGGFGTPEGGFILRWINSDISRQRLGYPETVRQLERRLADCDPANRSSVAAELDVARSGKGPTVFDWLVEIIKIHGEGGEEAEDRVELDLR